MSTSLFSYVVYMPHGPMSSPYPFEILKNAKVSELGMAIRAHPEFEDDVKHNKIILFKCGDLATLPANTRYERSLEWLRAPAETAKMEPSFRLSEYFPSGPAPEEDKKIDVIAVTNKILDTLVRPTTPENKTSIVMDGTPRRSANETQKMVDQFLSEYDAGLNEYLAGPPWSTFWEPPSTDVQTAQFIKSLEIPAVSGKPVLLLHRLGDGVVDPSVVDGLFTEERSFLVNTSGSGKTRLLFEGLIRHWGFYFSPRLNSAIHELGSADMTDMIDLHIPNSKGFVHSPKDLDDKQLKTVFTNNHYIAERRVHQILRARILIFEHFLKTAQSMYPNRAMKEFKKHWLFLQLFPDRFHRGDIFRNLSEVLTDASDEYLMMKQYVANEQLKRLQDDFSLDKEFFLVLDEAQVAMEKLDESFRSANEMIARPVLRPIVTSWLRATKFPIIVSGTGLSIDIVNEVIRSAVGKPNSFKRVTRTGAFDDKERQREYILRYMPPHIAKTDSGMEFLERAWLYIRGRHRFTSSLLTELLKRSFDAPHTILNAFVKAFCGFFPSDGQRFIDDENVAEDTVGFQFDISTFDFSKVINNNKWLRLFSGVLYTWLVLQRRNPLSEKDERLVELGFARFVNLETRARIDEPLVLLAAAHQFAASDYSWSVHIKEMLQDEAGKGKRFEMFVAYYLAGAFGDRTNLCDVFDFGEEIPDWAKQPAELVSIAFKDGRVEANRFHLPSSHGATTTIGCECKTVEETMEWIENPSSVMCFPDQYMGPDTLLFLRLACGLILAVFVQDKWRNLLTLSKGTLDDAVKSIDVSRLYEKKGLTAENGKARKQKVVRMLKHLNGPNVNTELDGWAEDGVPVLKVIASFPAEISKIPPHHVALNMDRCCELEDSGELLKSIKARLGVKRSAPVEGDDVSTKRPRKGKK